MRMMQFSVRTQVIIGAVSLLCLLLAGTSFALLRQIGPSPASLLPADRTVMLVSNLSPAMQKKLQTVLPALADAPLRGQDTPVAALVRSGTALTWVTFDARGNAQTSVPLLTESETPLSSDAAFRQLRQTYDAQSPWLFVRFPETPLHVDGLTGPTVPASVTVGTGAVQIAWPTRMQTGFTGPVPQESNGTVLRVSAAQLTSFLTSATTLLTEQNRLTVKTLLTAWISHTVGPEVSAAYDVLPLLDGAGTLTVAQTGSGTDIALRALPHDARDASLVRIEQGIVSVAAGTERVQRTFDEKFSFDTIRLAEGDEAETAQIGAWSVHLSPAASTMAGRMGREWAFGTDRALFTTLLQAMQSSAGQHIAEGTVDPAALNILLERWRIHLALPWDLLPAGKDVFWTLDRKGGLAVLSVSR
jgi:hypothetical protein